MQEDTPIRWEDKLPENRSYKAENLKVILKASFNDPKIIDIVEKCFADDPKSFFLRNFNQSKIFLLVLTPGLKSGEKSEVRNYYFLC